MCEVHVVSCDAHSGSCEHFQENKLIRYGGGSCSTGGSDLAHWFGCHGEWWLNCKGLE